MNTPPTADALQALQDEVQRLMGRCLLRLQQCEHLLKAVVAHHGISIADASNKTMGTLVSALIGKCATNGGQKDAAKQNAPTNIISSKMKMGLRDLGDLVLLRNSLVHHFIDQHDLWNLDGCRSAQESLVAACSRIDQHFEQLRGWAEHMGQARRLAADFAQSDASPDLVTSGMAPAGLVDWPAAGIVRALREAADNLAVEEWTPVASAGRWIAKRHPDQLPAKYGCSSWRQVVHESRLFEIQCRKVNGQRVAWYQPKPEKHSARAAHSR